MVLYSLLTVGFLLLLVVRGVDRVMVPLLLLLFIVLLLDLSKVLKKDTLFILIIVSVFIFNLYPRIKRFYPNNFNSLNLEFKRLLRGIGLQNEVSIFFLLGIYGCLMCRIITLCLMKKFG